MELESRPADLLLLQLSDSALPIGGYSNSWGFETWVQLGHLRTAVEVQGAIETLLISSIAPQDGTACALSWKCCRDGNLDTLRLLNEYLTASRWTKETLNASLSMGQRLKRLAADAGWPSNFPPDPLAQDPHAPASLSDPLSCDFPLHHSTAFGWLAAAGGVPLEQSVASYLYSSTVAIVSACVRLVPLGHTDGQRILSNLRPLIATQATLCTGRNLDDLGGFAPLHEWACREHESLYSRLFQS